METKYFTPQEIAVARLSYAEYHDVDYSVGVEVTEYTDSTGIIGFRLSLKPI